MFFTQEDYRNIEKWLYNRTVKDTDFNIADKLDGREILPIIQDGKNKIVGLNDFIKQLCNFDIPDFYNVTVKTKKTCLTLKEAVALIPPKARKLGLTITFHNECGNWVIYHFVGTSLNQWDNLKCWENIIQQALDELTYFPDEEDITGVQIGKRKYLKFKDREYNPDEFQGNGMIILRKNLVGTDACSIDDKDHVSNILTQEMINQEHTIYVIEYDFDLDGKVISIPEGSTLWFQGGSLSNGSVYLNEAAILGVFEFADIGNVKIFGKFNTGQIMTFSDDSYKAKTGGYFIPSQRDSSLTTDPKNDKELYYDINPDAYTTQTRQELRWWNGKEWLLILDITDYNEIKSIISDIIDKHNEEMSASYYYFKNRIVNIENDITSITETVNNLSTFIENIDNYILNKIEQYISGSVLGCTSITVNGETFTPDENGNITLPDYPSGAGGGDGGTADRTKGTLTIRTNAGSELGSFNGEKDVTITLPKTENTGQVVTNEPLTIKYGDEILDVYNGEVAKTVTIPVPDIGSPTQQELSNLIVKLDNSDTKYDPTNTKDTIIDLNPISLGNNKRPIVLFTGVIRRTSGKQDWHVDTYSSVINEFITGVTIAKNNAARMEITLNTKSGFTAVPLSAICCLNSTGNFSYSTIGAGQTEYMPLSFMTGINSSTLKIYVTAFFKDNSNQRSTTSTGFGSDDSQMCASFNILITGYIRTY